MSENPEYHADDMSTFEPLSSLTPRKARLALRQVVVDAVRNELRAMESTGRDNSPGESDPVERRASSWWTASERRWAVSAAGLLCFSLLMWSGVSWNEARREARLRGPEHLPAGVSRLVEALASEVDPAAARVLRDRWYVAAAARPAPRRLRRDDIRLILDLSQSANPWQGVDHHAKPVLEDDQTYLDRRSRPAGCAHPGVGRVELA